MAGFVDNDGVLHSLTRGGGGGPDSFACIGLLWLEVASFQTDLHCGRVESASNIADGPTREEFEGVQQFRVGCGACGVEPRLFHRACCEICTLQFELLFSFALIWTDSLTGELNELAVQMSEGSRCPLKVKPSFLQASQWVQDFLQAFAVNNDTGVMNALRAAESLKLDKDDMRASGALFILSTPQVWVGLSDVMQLRRSQLLIKWHATPSGIPLQGTPSDGRPQAG